jgi:flagellar basal body rod protein FlgC
MNVDLLQSAAAGMDAQRAALDVAARNVAAAEAAGRNGGYARLIPDFRITRAPDGEALLGFAGTHVQRGTNVDILTEMIAAMNASRAYEADASLFDVGKTLAEKTIALGQV